MLGMILTLVGDIVIDEYGHDLWDDLLDAARSNGAYTALGVYPDEEFTRVVAAAADRLQVPQDQVMHDFGRRLLDHLARAHPDIVAHDDLPSFLAGLTGNVHAKVAVQYPSAEPPTFTIVEQAERSLVLRYQSARRLCQLAEGMVLGAAERFGIEARVSQSCCAHIDSSHCDLVVAW